MLRSTSFRWTAGQYFGGDSVGVTFELDETGSSRVVAERALRLADIGAYRVLLRLKEELTAFHST